MRVDQVEETVYFINGNYKKVRRWINLAICKTVEVWTLIRPIRGQDLHTWKVYMIEMGQIGPFPISATDPYWLFKKLVEHESFAFFLSNNTNVTILAEAWSTEGHRLPSEDIAITGSKISFQRTDLPETVTQEKLDGVNYSHPVLSVLRDRPPRDTDDDFGQLLKDNLRDQEDIFDPPAERSGHWDERPCESACPDLDSDPSNRCSDCRF